MTNFLLLLWLAPMMQEPPPLQNAQELVMRITVSDMERSLHFYTTQLGLLKTGEIFPEWAKLNIPGAPKTFVGLKLVNPPEGSGGAVTTFVVPDIEKAIARLRKRGIEVEDPRHLAGGVKLAFFQDPDGNRLAVRQNP